MFVRLYKHQTTNMVIKFNTQSLLNFILLGFLLGGSFSIFPSSRSESLIQNSEWAAPINLSHSGSTSNPQLIVDSTGRFDAIWIDQFAGYVTAYSYIGASWSKPTSVNTPFGVRDGTPVFLSDSSGYIDAFWIDRTNVLLYSRVSADKFSDATAWGDAQQLAESAADFSVVLDNNGTIHLAYTRLLSTEELPSGIYYQNSQDSGTTWSDAQLLYKSQYFRSLKPEDTNINLSVNEEGAVYIVWDNRPLKLLLFIKSQNDGNTWLDPQVIRGSQPEDGSNIPFGINITTNGNNALIIWDLGQPNANCNQYSQWSTNNGDAWNAPVLVSQNQYGCSPKSKMFVNQDGTFLLMTTQENQPAILAWDASRWSNRQNVISSFIDPDTNRSVNYQGQQILIVNNSQIYVIGYDEGGLGDTWLFSRSLGTISDWFPKPSSWSKPEVVFTSLSELSSPSVVVDEKNQFHVFWIQKDQVDSNLTYSIYYARWDGNQWSQPVNIYSAPQGEISHLAAAVQKEQLLIVWSESADNSILFSWSNIDNGINPAEWITPVVLSTARYTGTSPVVLADNSGVIYVAYSKPINEERGIYIVKSTDNGKNWSDPNQVFNGEAAGWDLIGPPALASDEYGSINVIWGKESYPADSNLLGLYSSQSRDQGSNWSSPELVAEGEITGLQFTGTANYTLHRIWQAVDVSARLVNWHQYSINGGATWSQPTSITDPEDYVATPVVTTDTAGRLYLFQPIQISPQMTGITYRLWDTEQWQVGDRIVFSNPEDFTPDSLAAAISPSGNLMLVYLGQATDSTTGSTNYSLSFVSQTIEIPAITQTPKPTLGVEETQTPTLVPTDNTFVGQVPTEEQTPSQTDIDTTPPPPTGSPITDIILGGGLTALVVVVVFSFRLITLSKRK